ncbi:hypothetical protein [Corynebacterium caspium]|uniref:hypothetical protein n=1 Tax=Corynebacterium caspium TaxID=234828 RepID=UPI0003768C56|nr:hypothetical protein [Corynebacterium caspium]WKD59687.1 hypothetical protein CCASP_06540 [Corynebacterium caspium DSM 44850]
MGEIFMHSKESQRYTLSAATHLIIRSRHIVQLGLDATRAGLLEVYPVEATQFIGVFLKAQRQPFSLLELQENLLSLGFSKSRAVDLLSDLKAINHLVPVTAPLKVLLLGHSPLAECINELLIANNFSVNRPAPGCDDITALEESAGRYPIIAVEKLAHTWWLAASVLKYAPTYIPVSLIDTRGVIGPARISGTGPCAVCVDLYRCAVDPEWYRLVAQSPAGPAFPDPLLVTVTAAYAVNSVARILKRPALPTAVRDYSKLSISTADTAPVVLQFGGEQLVVDLDNGIKKTEIPMHPRCPHCGQQDGQRDRASPKLSAGHRAGPS